MILERDTTPPASGEGGIPAPAAETTFGGRLGERLRDASDLERAVGQVAGVGDDPGLGLLLDLAQRGEYDPWNVDIVAVTDSYLEALDDRLDAQDLRRVARLIFYAAALIHLKAKALAERQKHLDYQAALEQALAEEFGDAFDGEGGPLSRLRPDDQPLDYGFLADGEGGTFVPQERPVRERGLSLIDLIVALREYDERLAQQELLESDEPVFTEEMALEECVGGSHQEDLGQDIIDVRLRLWGSLADAPHVTLEQLVGGRVSRAGAYVALLFLAQDEEVLLEQDTFYGELRVVRGPYFGEVRAGVLDDEEVEALVEQSQDEDEPEETGDPEGEDALEGEHGVQDEEERGGDGAAEATEGGER